MFHITEVSKLGQPVAPKKVKDKFVPQCGEIVRDNVPIKYTERKGKQSKPYMVPDSNLVKGWTLVKMATQFQNFKKKLTRDLSRTTELQIGMNIRR
jgi:hypothetical protein